MKGYPQSLTTKGTKVNTDPLLVSAIQAIAARCDGAHDQDGRGFNGTDTVFGKSLAAIPAEAWSQENAREAWEILRKYRHQLELVGINYDDIPVPEGTGSRGIKVVDAEGGRYVIRFSYDPYLVSQVKMIVNSRWNSESKVWTASPRSKADVERFAAANDFSWTQAARDLTPSELPEAVSTLGHITLDGDWLVIRFAYDAAAVAAVKNILGRVWDGERKVWLAPMTSIRQVREFATQFVLVCSDEVNALPDVEPDTAPHVEVVGGCFLIRFPYDRDLIAAVRDLPGAMWMANAHGWVVDLDAAVEVLDFVEHTKATINENAVDAFTEARAALVAIAESQAHDAEIEVAGLGGDLLPFQRAGVAYASRVRRTFIADEMGLGKTVQAIATLQNLDAFPALIVCPASLKVNWSREVAKWLPSRSVEILNGTRPLSRGEWPDVLIVNYDILHAWSEVLPDLKGLVVDESHYAKNPTARRTKAVIEVSDKINPEGCVLALTGTPVVNAPGEIVPQLRILGRLKEFGGSRGFRERYGYGKNLAELNRRLRSTCFVRRRKADVLTELPPKRWSHIVIEGDATIMAEYRTAESNLLAYLADKAREYALETGASEHEAQGAAWQAMMRAKAAEHLVAVTALKRIAARAKMTAAQQWIEDFLPTGKKLVAFGWHRDVVDMVAETFANGVKIQGGMDHAARQGAVDAFQTSEEQKVISCSIRAAGVGLTLTAASDVLFLEQGWNPADMDQAADRCHRIGQHDSVTAWTMLVAGTIDEDIAALIEDKRSLVNAATDGGVDQEQASVLGDLLVRLAERGLAA